MKLRWVTGGLFTAALVLCLFFRASHAPPLAMLKTHQAEAPFRPAETRATDGKTLEAPQRKPPLTRDELTHYWPNETGVVPILEYHEIADREAWMSRSFSNFKNDLERLYVEDYRPVSMSDYLSNRIDLPAGKSPVVLTFDDSRGTQFHYNPDGSVDPNCAVAIMKNFHESHPDFPLKATFFVLPEGAFEQPATAAKKLKALVSWGFDLGNHTVRHRLLHRLSDAQVEKEIGGCAAILHEIVPAARIDTVAFPGGHSPRNHRLIARGRYKGYHYFNRAGFLAACAPAPSPVARHQDRLQIERIVACEGPCGITYWLNQVKSGEIRRYVSDGDPATTTVPQKFAKMVDPARLNGAVLRIY